MCMEKSLMQRMRRTTINLLNRFIEESEISLDKNRVKELIGGLYNKACEVD